MQLYFWTAGCANLQPKSAGNEQPSELAAPDTGDIEEEEICSVCNACEAGDILLICDKCESAAHPKCVGLKRIPKVSLLL